MIDFIDEGGDAPQYLIDVRELEKTFGIDGTFSRTRVFDNFETYSVLQSEATFTLAMAMLAVIVVVFFITVSLQVTAIVACVVILVNVYMVGTAYFWDLHMNVLLVLNMSFCLGVSVDYSTHIA